jgi:hypothetical protein
MAKKEMKSIVILFVMILTLSSLAYAQKIDLEIKDSYSPGNKVDFKVSLYDNNNQKIQGEVDYKVQNYYSDIIQEGNVKAGEFVSFDIPADTAQKPWKITVKSGDSEISRLFNIAELEKAKISLEEDTLVITNLGNVPYEKNILIYIGNNDQTASVYLDVGQTKMIRLTAPQGDYDVKVIEGNDESPIEFRGVSLSGNVIGLESVNGKNLVSTYPIIWIFLITLVLAFVVVYVMKFGKKAKVKKK